MRAIWISSPIKPAPQKTQLPFSSCMEAVALPGSGLSEWSTCTRVILPTSTPYPYEAMEAATQLHIFGWSGSIHTRILQATWLQLLRWSNSKRDGCLSYSVTALAQPCPSMPSARTHPHTWIGLGRCRAALRHLQGRI